MNILEITEFWIITYLISAVCFGQCFRSANRQMKNAGILTISLEFLSALFALLFIFIFPFKIPNDIKIYITMFIVTIIYAVIDRLNIETRYGLAPSTFSMLKQLSSAFLIVLGILILKEEIVITKIIGAVIILVSNLFLTYEKGKFNIL